MISTHTMILEKKDIEITRFKVKIEEVVDKATQILKCRSLARVYTLFLKKQILVALVQLANQ